MPVPKKRYSSSPWSLNELRQVLFELSGRPVFDKVTKAEAARIIQTYPKEKYSQFISDEQLGYVLKYGKRRGHLPVAFDLEVWERLANSASNYRDKLFLWFVYHASVRISEACNARIENLDRKRLRIKILGKGDKEAYVDIVDKKLWEELLSYVGERRDGPIFLSNRKKLFSPKTWQKKIKSLGKRAGLTETDLRKMSFHKARHSWAVHALQRGVSVASVQSHLRHENPATTLQYQRLTQEQVRKELEEKMAVAEETKISLTKEQLNSLVKNIVEKVLESNHTS